MGIAIFSVAITIIVLGFLAWYFSGNSPRTDDPGDYSMRRETQEWEALKSKQYVPSKEWYEVKAYQSEPKLLELLPSEISDSVFKRIEAEWEKEHPDPKDEKIRELELKLKSKDSVIAGKSSLIAKLLEENEGLRKDNKGYQSLFGSPAKQLISVDRDYDGTLLRYKTLKEDAQW